MEPREANSQLYEKIQALVQKEATDIAKNLINQNNTQYKIGQPTIHYHDGVDLPQLEEKNLITNIRYNTFLIEDTTETFSIVALPNLRRISFYGFAADNKTGAATKRAVCSGEAQFGRCYEFSGVGTILNVTTNKQGTPIIQGGSAMYVDSTDLTKNRVSASNTSLISVVDGTGTEIVNLTITSYDTNVVVFSATLAANWKLQGSLTFT